MEENCFYLTGKVLIYLNLKNKIKFDVKNRSKVLRFEKFANLNNLLKIFLKF